MNYHNSQYENDDNPRQNSDGSYSYVFSNGDAPTPHSQSTATQKKRAWALPLTVCLCVFLSFFAGVGGFLCMEFLTKEGGWFSFGDTQNVLSDNAQDLINRDDSEASIYGSAGEDVFAVSEVVRKVKDTVVVIDVRGNSFSSGGSGSGVIISANGYILTCHHVVENASAIKVTLNSGTEYDAALVGSDEASDLAVLKIDTGAISLPYAEHGRSEHLVVGEVVVAIGNPLGTLGGTVTNGIISATERNVATSDGNVMTLIQTNAAINSGNSGGGLFNLDGELIGIVNAKYSASGVEGLAFAIPIDSAYVVELDLIEHGYVRNIPDHGLSLFEVTDFHLRYYGAQLYARGIQEVGLYVTGSEHSDEIQEMDKITAVNGVAVSTELEFESAFDGCKVGDNIQIELLRKVDEEDVKKTVTITLEEYIPDRLK